MSYKSRQAKRKKNTATVRAQVASRRSGTSSTRWWLTIVSRKTACADCGRILKVGDEMVYRRSPGASLCQPCADREKIFYRLSVTWERSRARRTRTGAASMRDQDEPGRGYRALPELS